MIFGNLIQYFGVLWHFQNLTLATLWTPISVFHLPFLMLTIVLATHSHSTPPPPTPSHHNNILQADLADWLTAENGRDAANGNCDWANVEGSEGDAVTSEDVRQVEVLNCDVGGPEWRCNGTGESWTRANKWRRIYLLSWRGIWIFLEFIRGDQDYMRSTF